MDYNFRLLNESGEYEYFKSWSEMMARYYELDCEVKIESYNVKNYEWVSEN